MADTLICPNCESVYADFNIIVRATVTIDAPVHVVASGTTRWGPKPYAGHDSDFLDSVDKIANKATWREAAAGEKRLTLDVDESGGASFMDEEVIEVRCDNCGDTFGPDDGYEYYVDLDGIPQ